MKTYRLNIGGERFDVAIESLDAERAEVTVNGQAYSVALETEDETLSFPAPADKTAVAPTPVPPAPATGAVSEVLSPLPGVIVEVCVRPGESVRAGRKVAVLEAMKMENDILAEKDGTVREVCVGVGDSVLEGAKIVIIG